ncbi:MAG: response regulator, partial [Pseudomonadota bacterium]
VFQRPVLRDDLRRCLRAIAEPDLALVSELGELDSDPIEGEPASAPTVEAIAPEVQPPVVQTPLLDEPSGLSHPAPEPAMNEGQADKEWLEVESRDGPIASPDVEPLEMGTLEAPEPERWEADNTQEVQEQAAVETAEPLQPRAQGMPDVSEAKPESPVADFLQTPVDRVVPLSTEPGLQTDAGFNVAETEFDLIDGQPPAIAEPRLMRVLVAEDNRTNRLVIEKMLKTANIDLVFAENGALAVEQFEWKTPDLIFTDISMPVLDGKAAAQRIRAIEEERKSERCPIVAITAHAMEGDAEDILAAGIDHYMTKPVKKAELFGYLTQFRPPNVPPVFTEEAQAAVASAL